MTKHKIDTAALLATVDIVKVIDARVPLKKSGVEFEACCPFHNEATPSFKVNPAKQFYHCFGCGANGDAIKFLQEYEGLSFQDACQALGADVVAPASTKPSQPAPPAPPAEEKPKTEWVPILPVPDGTPEPPLAHRYRGKYSKRWEYRDAEGRLLGYTCRFEKASGGKEILPLTWCQSAETGEFAWEWIAFPEKRPLYGLDRLAAKPDAFVLVVEGEKCADAAQAELPELVVVSWPGGGKAVGKADWSPLAKRKAGGWADCDAKRERLTPADREAGIIDLSKPLLPEEKQPGVMAMAKIGELVLAQSGRWWDVKIPAPGEKPDGWDVADAIDEGLRGGELAEHVRKNLTERKTSEPASTPTEADAGKERKGPFIPGLIWGRDGLKNCLSNVYQILAHRPEWKGVVAYDEFSLCVVKRKLPPFAEGSVGEWDSTDDSRAAMWLAQLNPDWSFTPSSDLVAEAIEVLGRANAFHPVREYLRALTWDGTPRLEAMLSDFLGVRVTPYTQRAGKWWLMGAVKRVLEPGAKFDYCLVLAGTQGKKKSTFFSVIGGEWFSDTDLDLGSKDGMSNLRGVLIQEFPELGSLARAEEKKQKSFLSRRVDHYRPVYGRREIKSPRQVVFCGTTNEHEWNKDPTGGRRFWPVDCLFDEIDVEALAASRDQLFAEAMHYVTQGERYWPTQEEQRLHFDPEQIKVEQQDSLVDAVHDWVWGRVADFSMYEVAADCLKLDASKLTRDLQTRLGVALRKLGCTRVEKRNGMIRYWYKPPVKNEASSSSGSIAQHGMGVEDVGF